MASHAIPVVIYVNPHLQRLLIYLSTACKANDCSFDFRSLSSNPLHCQCGRDCITVQRRHSANLDILTCSFRQYHLFFILTASRQIDAASVYKGMASSFLPFSSSARPCCKKKWAFSRSFYKVNYTVVCNQFQEIQ